MAYSNKLKRDDLGFTQITLEEALTIAAEDVDSIILDVRTREEYQMGHIETAVLLPYDEIEEHAEAVLPSKEDKILIYCRAGRRSLIAAAILAEMGYQHIYEFGGPVLWEE